MGVSDPGTGSAHRARALALLPLAAALALTGGVAADGPRPALARSPGGATAIDTATPHGRPVRAEKRILLGRSTLGRPVRALERGGAAASRRALVVGCIHGDECAGLAVARRLERERTPAGVDLWVLPLLDPDGYASGHRQNGHGVDLNRNFPAAWRPLERPWDPQYSGPRPASEPETRIAMALVRRTRPRVTIWYHQYRGSEPFVRAWGGSQPAARRYAKLAGIRFRRMRWLAGTAPNWQNHRFPGTASFVVELPPGPLAPADAERHARAVLALARGDRAGSAAGQRFGLSALPGRPGSAIGGRSRPSRLL